MANKINFYPAVSDTAKNMQDVVDYILKLRTSPEEKIKRINNLFNLIGSDFYMQMFNANSELFDSAAIGTTDYNAMTDQIERLSKKIVQNDNLGREVDTLIKDFYESALGRAQDEAFRNAISLDKHPTVTRSMVGETCGWCKSLVGTFSYVPNSDIFRRHANCDCLIVVSGLKSRNGIINNYVKNSKHATRSAYEARTKIGVTQKYWSDEMNSEEKWFAQNYPERIKWIDRNIRDTNGVRLPSNDYILLSNTRQYELKTSQNLKYKTIKENIKRAINKAPTVKTRFMISAQNKTMSTKLKYKLRNYALENTRIEELRIFDANGEEVLFVR